MADLFESSRVSVRACSTYLARRRLSRCGGLVMSMVERDSELKALRDLFVRCNEGNSKAALITGDVASGKTELLHSFAGEAVSQGAIFLQATASHTESSLPLGVIGQLVSSAAPFAENDESTRRLIEAAAHSVPSPEELNTPPSPNNATNSPGGLEIRNVSRLAEALFEISKQKPVIIGIDDVHFADAASLEVLLYILRRASLRPTRLLLLLTACASRQLHHPRFHAEILRYQQGHQIRLHMLSQEGVANILAEKLGARTARRLTPVCYELSGGNPLLVHALLEDYRAAGSAELAGIVPGEAFGRAVSACLYRSAPLTLDVARAMAVMGQHASPAVLSDIVEADPDSLANVIDSLHGLGLLSSGQFRDAAVREAVLRSADHSDLHSQAARVLHDHGASATIVAKHLVSTGRVEGSWTAPVLREASEQALADDDIEYAVAWLRLACRTTSNVRELAAIKAVIARAKWRRNPDDVLPHLPELTSAAMNNCLASRNTNALVGYLLWFGQADQALEVLEAAERQGQNGAKGPNPIRTLLGWAHPRLLGPRQAGPVDSPLEHGSPVAHIMAAAHPSAILTQVALLTQNTGDDALYSAEQTLRDFRLDDHNLATLMGAVVTLVHNNKLDRARHWGDLLYKEAINRRAPLWQALFSNIRAFIAIRQGRMATAEKLAREALTLVPPKSWGVAIGSPVSNMVLAATALGNHNEAATFLNIPVPEAMFDTVAALPYLQARGAHHLAMNCTHTALYDFQTCGDLTAKWRIDVPGLVPWRTGAAQAWSVLGRTNRARDLLTEQLTRLGPADSRVRGISLRMLASLSDSGERARLLTEAVDALKESGDRFELGLAFADLGLGDGARGDEDRGRAQARGSYTTLREVGPEPTGAPPSREVETARHTVPHQSSRGAERNSQLTEAEIRVAVLAAEGHSNRQIAAKLFITTSTVEQHLTSVYRKLQTNRRTDLSAKLQSAIQGRGLEGCSTASGNEAG
ncbi:AAA family ATPase [Streptomyces sp. NPDC048516]|uniref:helix-turn-helix transcriptional regulator n=1 Tax=Streptomyces sp. NPDC048516 TaxID=3365565 RepID=UPI003711D1B6